MKLKSILTILALGVVLFSYCQKATMEISFTANDIVFHVPMDSVTVTNITQGGDTILYMPDSVLVLNYTTTGIGNADNVSQVLLSQNYPNPFTSKTSFDVLMQDQGQLNIKVYDISGKEISTFSNHFTGGSHKFLFNSEKEGLYILNVNVNSETHSIKMYCLGGDDNRNSEISYVGNGDQIKSLKSIESKSIFNYNYGDQLVAYGFYQTQFKNIVFKPTQDITITFLFQSTGICPPTIFDSRDSTTYKTVKLGNQCWMAENLSYLPSVTNSGIGSSTAYYYYVYDYQGTSVVDAKATLNYQNYGVLYNWPVAMDGASSSNNVPSGVQGVCMTGWHIPSDEEWKILEGAVDSQYAYPDPEWDFSSYRGLDVGGNLKSTDTTYWWQPNNGATNSSGFTALAGGDRNNLGSFDMQGMSANFWTSRDSGPDYGYARRIYYNQPSVYRSGSTYKTSGFSIRCVRD